MRVGDLRGIHMTTDEPFKTCKTANRSQGPSMRHTGVSPSFIPPSIQLRVTFAGGTALVASGHAFRHLDPGRRRPVQQQMCRTVVRSVWWASMVFVDQSLESGFPRFIAF